MIQNKVSICGELAALSKKEAPSKKFLWRPCQDGWSSPSLVLQLD
jgi:hypothetical protein